MTLALNVGFLSIPGIVPYSTTNVTLSMPRQMTILSLLVSIGSILIGLLLVRHNRTKQDVEPTEAVSEWLHLPRVSINNLDSGSISSRTLEDISVLT